MNLIKVTSMATLKAMAKQNLITLHNQTGTKISGLYGGKKFTCTYVDDGKYMFGYKNKVYTTRYVDGCFCPYVFQVVDTYAGYSTETNEFCFIVDPVNVDKISRERYRVVKI